MTYFLCLSILIPMFVSGAVVLYPFNSRCGIFFATSVPLEFSQGPQGKRILRDYRIRGAAIFLLCLIGSIFEFRAHEPNLAVSIALASIILYMLNWAVAIRQTHPYRIERPLVRTVNLGEQKEYRNFLWSFVPAFLPLIFAALYLASHWRQIPAIFAIHWGLNGQANAWMHRTFMGVFGGIIFALGMELFFLCISQMVRWTLNGEEPALLVMSIAAG